MCIILINYDTHPDFRMILASNRDEFYNRPAEQASFWNENPRIFSGRDNKGNGTWLGITETGRIACITNYRDPHTVRKGAPSRGKLVSGFLSGKLSNDDYLDMLIQTGMEYSGFNLIFGSADGLNYFSNINNSHLQILPGIHGLSNHLLDTPWPKVCTGKDAMASMVNMKQIELEEALFAMLTDSTVYSDSILPDTGVGLEMERMLSPVFVSSPVYGTRASTIILIGRDNKVTFIEKTYDNKIDLPGIVRCTFEINQN